MEKGKDNKEVNHIKIGGQTRVRNVITYALLLFNEKNFKDVTISAIGGAIGSLVNAVEVLKVELNLYQNNKISTVSYQTMDSNENIIQERLYPKMEVVLSKDEPKNQGDGYQGKMKEDDRKTLKAFLDKARENRENNREETRGGRGGDRGFRGGRGTRGSRGTRGTRGGRGRGDRGFRGGRGTRGGDRDGFSRGGDRGFRGGRGNSRGRGGESRGRGGEFRGRGESRGRGGEFRGRGFSRGRGESRGRGF